MFTHGLFALLQATAAGDSTYASPALRALVERAAVENRRIPSTLAAYSARVESELAITIRDTLDRELNANPQQFAGEVRWTPERGADVRITAMRTPPLGAPIALTSVVRSWFTPTLYGERLHLGFGISFGAVEGGDGGTVRGLAHPLSADRERFYRYAGGDTAVTILYGGRRIPVVRVLVTPRPDMRDHVGVFEGSIDLDADRFQVVRIRGRFAQISLFGIRDELFADLQNAEIEGRYWLPAFQRVELQGGVSWLADERMALRAVSIINQYEATIDTSRTDPPRDASPASVRVTTAFSDSAAQYEWQTPLGTLTVRARSSDFDDVAHETRRTTGPPVIGFVGTRADRLIRFNRIEGLFTGLEASVLFRDAAPGVAARAFAGWAWSEETIRGGIAVTGSRGGDIVGATGERALVSTNDFRWRPGGMEGGFGAFLGTLDDNDYIDRRSLRGWWTHDIGGGRRALLTARAERGQDRAEVSRLAHGLFSSRGRFRPNRGSLDGAYLLGGLDLELRSSSAGNLARGGVAGLLRYEAAAGDLAWQRAEASGLIHRSFGDALTFAARGNVAMVAGAVIPPQQLIEISATDGIGGTSYKQYAGDRAATAAIVSNLASPFWRRGWRVRRMIVPGIRPGIGGGVTGGWTDLSSPEARLAAMRLAAPDTALRVPGTTGGVRASVVAGLTFFSGSILVGARRPLGRPGPWEFTLGSSFFD